MKKLILFNATIALSIFVTNICEASLPAGVESFTLRTTLNIQNSPTTIRRVSFANKDLLTIIQNEYGVNIPSGAQLVITGLGSSLTNQFVVLSSNGRTNIIANASWDNTGYALFFAPTNFAPDFTMPANNTFVLSRSGGGPTYSFTFALADLHYNNAAGTAGFDLIGLTRSTVNVNNGNESFSMPSGGSGPFTLIAGTGVINGSASGSGRDVANPFFALP
jgi:hypothetical protein